MSRSLAIVEVSRTRPGREDYHAYVQILNGRLLTLARESGWEAQRFAAEDLGAARLLERTAGVDALVLAGGEDIAPEAYGAQRGYRAEGPHAERADAAQIALVHRALAEGTPLLGICRGLQIVNVALGGTLVQDLGPSSEHVTVSGPASERMHPHDVDLVHGSTLSGLFGAGPLAVQSAHHQAVDRLAPGLRVVARAKDGVIEAVEHTRAPIVGVQWHPEDRGAPRGQLETLFEGFLGEAVVQGAVAA
ncbi:MULTISPECIES: gamma-glutamyl-gamma-aminobutyrate hydrolase family protein [unclassified Rathayibacter]|uniref:gamma-glutamyl-gamma-aminobutyrate hydrolase family protein n=1 Tax=unclassified Rathayibacter TaxID=2609250 RepID=UPI00188BA19D|nr:MULTISPECIES: gamma-glutamyl-gamma-aminobutyrate hydrolase family protein [unclassified Rathayibacter]MBF4462766.1 gamma-glutamyl-gamma-aminobutyrate hydrolase family protein [Rathayibacter sp. VKM Ac-2879]MBF4504180.1 gamma-glutamyl-gamma-aminobutyrate hydrolase family protein [Rathayibacter sp. VKM Ac-2878]